MLVLEFHGYKMLKPAERNELVALFLFSLASESNRQAGIPLDRQNAFWTEVKLSRDLAQRGRWPKLTKTDKIKAMFHWAQTCIQERGTKLRDAPMFWTATSPLADGPNCDLASVRFPKADPVTFDATQDMQASGLASREGAGLLK